MGVYWSVLFPGAHSCIAVMLLPFKEQGGYIKWVNLNFPFPSSALFMSELLFFFHMLSVGQR